MIDVRPIAASDQDWSVRVEAESWSEPVVARLGELIDPTQLPAAVPWIALLLALVAIAKVGVVWALARLARLEVRALQLAVGLGQLGEFSFVLAAAAVAAGAIDGVLFTAIIATVALSIAASSIAVRLVPVPAGAAVPVQAA